MAPIHQPGPTSFDTKKVYGIEIAFPSSSPALAARFWPVNLWIDDVYLYKELPSP